MLYCSKQKGARSSALQNSFTVSEWESALSQLPRHWVLTPIRDLRSVESNWQKEEAIAHSEFLELYRQGQPLPDGVGLRLGIDSGGLLAIEVNGEQAEAELSRLSGQKFPKTVSWTSGQPNHCQFLFQIPQRSWSQMETKKVDCGSGASLEFRWDGCLSVLPLSVHPETGQYRWLNSPSETEVALAPSWLLDLLSSASAAPEADFEGLGSSDRPNSNSSQLREEIASYQQQHLSESERLEIIYELARHYRINVSGVKALWKALAAESERQELLAEASSERLPSLLATRSERLVLERFLPDSLAKLMSQTAEAMPGPVEGIAVTVLAAAAGCLGTAARVMVKRSCGYVQPCVLRTVLVGPTGSLKTPLQRIAIAPLMRLEKEAHSAYKREVRAYKKALAAAEGTPLEPPEPIRQRYVVDNITTEKTHKIHAECPRGFLAYRDELAGYFKAFNQYKRGRGDDREIDLSEYNGAELIRDRVGDDSIFLERSAISRTGSIHPETLQELMGKGDDNDGFFARWLIAAPPFKPHYKDFLDEEESSSADLLQEQLYQLYRRLREFPERVYALSREAKERFQTWQHYLVDRTLAERHLSMAAVYPKIEAYTARLAGVLHGIWAASAGVSPVDEISGETMEKAIYLARYFLSQAEWLHSAPSGASPGGLLARIQEYAARKGEAVSARDVKSAIAAVKKCAHATAEYIREFFVELAKAGYGVLQGQGTRLRYLAHQQQQQSQQWRLAFDGPPLTGGIDAVGTVPGNEGPPQQYGLTDPPIEAAQPLDAPHSNADAADAERAVRLSVPQVKGEPSNHRERPIRPVENCRRVGSFSPLDWLPDGPWKLPDGKLDPHFREAIASDWVTRFGGRLEQRLADVLAHFKKDPANLAIRWEQYAREYGERYESARTIIAAGGALDPQYQQRLLKNHRAVAVSLPEELELVGSDERFRARGLPGTQIPALAESASPNCERENSCSLGSAAEAPILGSSSHEVLVEGLASIKLRTLNTMLCSSKTRETALKWAQQQSDRYAIERDEQGHPVRIVEVRALAKQEGST